MPGARLAALQASTGKVLWNVKLGNRAAGEFVSSAPVAWHGIRRGRSYLRRRSGHAPRAVRDREHDEQSTGCVTALDAASGAILVRAPRTDAAAIAAFVENPLPPMPKLHPSPLSDEMVNTVAEYVRELQSVPPHR